MIGQIRLTYLIQTAAVIFGVISVILGLYGLHLGLNFMSVVDFAMAIFDLWLFQFQGKIRARLLAIVEKARGRAKPTVLP